jgi:hypothetical protein
MSESDANAEKAQFDVPSAVLSSTRLVAGQWYYECRVVSAGANQRPRVGWADAAFEGGLNEEGENSGVGDDEHSWGFEANADAPQLWHNGKAEDFTPPTGGTDGGSGSGGAGGSDSGKQIGHGGELSGEEWSRPWQPGDVLGVAVDITPAGGSKASRSGSGIQQGPVATMIFSLNGDWKNPIAMCENVSFDGYLRPAITLGNGWVG